MRLSTVFELLLIFLLIAFAAYARVIENNEVVLHRTVRSANDSKQNNVGVQTISLKQATDNVNKYCTCNENVCNCCRDFNIPVVQLKGPGCASLQYLQGDDLAVQLSFGDNILTNTIVSGKSPKPVCVPLPGGFSKFCGRIYSIKREANRHFKACLGLELQSSSDIEASLRVSCFRFGPDGLKLRPPEPLPVVESDSSSDNDDDDDDDDIFGLGSDSDDDEEDDDDDDDEDDEPAEANSVPASSSSDDNDSSDDDDDLLGLGALFDIFSDTDDDTTQKPKVTTPVPQFTIPLLTKPISEESPSENDDLTLENDVPISSNPAEPEKIDVTTEGATNDLEAADATLSETSTVSVSSSDESEAIQAVASNNVEAIVELDQGSSNDVNKIDIWNKKKPYVTSASVNAIQNDIKKPVIRPGKPDPVETVTSAVNNDGNGGNDDNDDDDNDDDDDDDDDGILEAADLDDDEDDEENDEEKDEDDNDDEKEEDEKEDEDESDEDDDDDKKKKPSNGNKITENEKDGTVAPEVDDDDVDDVDDDDDDDDDEEEDAVLSALVEDDDKEKTKDDKILNNETGNLEEDDADYGFNLAEFLARKRRMRSGRQSKVMRL